MADLLPYRVAARNAEHVFRRNARAAVMVRADRLPPSLAREVMTGWDHRYPLVDVPQPMSALAPAAQFAEGLIKDFGKARVAAAYDEERIRDHAENYAALCSRMGSLESCRSFGLHFGIEPPKARDITPAGERARWCDTLWWRRALRRVWTRECENAMRRAGIIRKGRQPYASDEAVEHRAARQRRTREWADARAMVSEDGEQLDLLPLMDRSPSNPAIRRTELMTRSRGFEELAKSLGHESDFHVLTTPSRFHAQRASGGVNPKWEKERARVRDGQRWLCRMWARARAELARRSVQFYGMRTVEPNHDATPHWNLLVFGSVQALEALRFIIRAIWLSDEGNEPGAQEHRVRVVRINPMKGSATGYIAKYIAKNLDGRKEDGSDALDGDGSHEAGLDGPSNARRAQAWASVHGIRQFQQVGGPPVGLWRELRRMREPVAVSVVEGARAAADASEWHGFIGALGGIDRARRRVSSVRGKYRRELRRPMVRVYRLAKRQWLRKCGPRVAWTRREALDHEMPAVWLDRGEARVTDRQGRDVLASTRYGEQPAPRAAGVCGFGLLGRFVSADTRPRRWRIEQKGFTRGSGPSCEGTRQADARGQCATGETGSDRPATPISSISPRSGLFSDLGPVAITVRGAVPPPDGSFAWVMTVPFRSAGAPASGSPMAWTAAESSQAGPH